MNPEKIKLTAKALMRYIKHRRIPKSTSNRLIIAGNGPSLADHIDNHIGILQQETVLCVNHFVDSEAYATIKPRYYYMLDPNLLLNSLSAERLERRNRSFANLNNKTDWELHLFCPFLPGQIILEDYLTAPSIQLHMCNIYNPYPGFTWPGIRNYVYKSGLFMPPPQNVLVAALYSALNMGCKEIYLIGAEHSWLEDTRVREDNTVCAIQNHFTGRSGLRPMYKSAPKHSETFKYHELLKALSRTFRSYWLLKEYAEFRGARIYNCTPGSYIDAFERKSLTVLEP